MPARARSKTFTTIEDAGATEGVYDIVGKYVFEGGIAGEKAEKEPGVFLFYKDGAIRYVPPGKRKIETSFTWKIENEVAQICEEGEILFSDGRVESYDIVFDKFGTLTRFIKQN